MENSVCSHLKKHSQKDVGTQCEFCGSIIEDFYQEVLPEKKTILKILDYVNKTYRKCIPILETETEEQKVPSCSTKETVEIKEVDIVPSYVVTMTKDQATCGGPPLNWFGPQPLQSYEVFFGNIPLDATLEEIMPIFEDCGPIWSVRLIMDPLSTLSRGFGYVNFTTKEDVATTIEMLNGLSIKGTGAIQVNENVPNCLYVGNIPKNKGKDEIKTEFSIISGGIWNVISAETKPNWGFCLVEYDSIQSAAFAKQQLGSIKVFGTDIIVDWADPNEAIKDKIVDGAAEREKKVDASAKIKVLHVGNISKRTSMEHLKELFGEHGPVQLVEKFLDYAFVHYEHTDDAAKAKEDLNGRTVDGASLTVSFK